MRNDRVLFLLLPAIVSAKTKTTRQCGAPGEYMMLSHTRDRDWLERQCGQSLAFEHQRKSEGVMGSAWDRRCTFCLILSPAYHRYIIDSSCTSTEATCFEGGPARAPTSLFNSDEAKDPSLNTFPT
ncbi:hypothetical protein BJV77DRAFT_634272 [Russula vinacea]|nr:hypothetical protein BJV77DRAFT_634272 [Russula vinacea]